MCQIITLHDPHGAYRKEYAEIPDGSRLFDYLLATYPGGFKVPTCVYAQRVSDDCKIDLAAHIDQGYVVSKDETIIIAHTPQEAGTVALAITLGSMAIAAIVLYVSSRTQEVELPIDEPESRVARRSPNNSVSGQSNLARPMQRIPDIYGRNRAYPDLIALPYVEYLGQREMVTEYFCVGVGTYTLEAIHDGDTPLLNIPEATAELHGVYSRPSTVYAASEVTPAQGQRIRGPNVRKIHLPGPFPASFEITFVPQGNYFYGTDDHMREFAELTFGDDIIISAAATGWDQSTSAQFLGGPEVNLGVNQIYPAGAYMYLGIAPNFNLIGHRITSTTATTITLEDPLTGDPRNFTAQTVAVIIDANFNNSGTYFFDRYETQGVGTGLRYIIYVQGTPLYGWAWTNGGELDSTALYPNQIGPYQLAGLPTEVWVNLEYPDGLGSPQAAPDIPVIAQVIIGLQPVDENGDPLVGVLYQQHTSTVNAYYIDAYRFTIKIPLVATGVRYTVEVRNVSLEGAAENEKLVVNNIYAMEAVTVPDFGNVTTMLVRTLAAERGTSRSSRKINTVATRWLRTYNSGSGITPGLQLTTKFADAMLEILTNPALGNKPEASIDLEALYAIQTSLDTNLSYPNQVLGKFCYTFSDTDTPVQDELVTCGKACRVTAVRNGDTITFFREEDKPVRTALFNNRNKKPDSEVKTVSFPKPGDPDGVIVEWLDEDSGKSQTIEVPDGGAALRPKRLRAAGIRNFEQASNLAQVEYSRILYMRTRLTLEVTAEGLMVDIGARVGVVDGTKVRAQGGEILSVNGGSFYNLSEEVDFEGQASGTILLRNDQGGMEVGATVFPGGTKRIFAPSLTITPHFRLDQEYQVGTLYAFTATPENTVSDYLVKTIKPSDDGYVKLELVGYAEEVYFADFEAQDPP